MPIFDGWVNTLTKKDAATFAADSTFSGVRDFFGADVGDSEGLAIDATVSLMDEAGIDRALISNSILAGGRFTARAETPTDDPVAACERFPDRFRAAPNVTKIPSIRVVCDAVELAAKHPLVSCIRVIPMFIGEPIGSRSLYPVYERCEALGIPVTINVGVPGPRLSAKLQDPMDLDDVCLDFPDLTIVAAHMGHPWEALMVRLMMKYENLHLMTSAYLAKYIDPVVVDYMSSRRGREKVMFGSDFPILPLSRAVDAAKSLKLSDDAMEAYLWGNARRVFPWELP